MTALEALEAIFAALNQNATFPADVAYAKRIAETALIGDLEKRSMSTWTDEEVARYDRVTGQNEHSHNCSFPGLFDYLQED